MSLDYKWMCPLCGIMIQRSTRLELVEERERHLKHSHTRKQGKTGGGEHE